MTDYAEPAWRLGARAAWGAACGVLLAMAIARAWFPTDGPPSAVPEGLHPMVLGLLRLEPREKGFYALSLLLGGLGSLLAAGCGRSWRLRGWGTFFAFVTLCITVNELARITLTNGASSLFALAAAGAAAACWLALTARRLPEAVSAAPSDPPRPRWYVHAGAVALILIIGVPAAPERVAASIGFDMHPVYFMIGPAVYFMGNMLPGIDYFSQYSLGWSWIFHFFIADTPAQTVLRYAVLTAVYVTVFHVGLYFFLNWLFRDWRIAAVICVAHLALNFLTERAFVAPSATPLRYPLIPLAAFLLAWLIERSSGRASAAWRRRLLAATLGASVFLNTETGGYSAIAVALVLLMTWPNKVDAVRQTAILAGESLVVLMALLLLAYGTGVLDPAFLRAQLEPFYVYGFAGLGAWPLDWKGFGWVISEKPPAADIPCLRELGLCAAWGEWNLLYQVVAPGAALATLGYVWVRARGADADRARHAALAFHALVALLMSAKFLNMSIIALWHVNSLGFLVVLAWWWKALLTSSSSPWLRRLIAAAGMVLLVLLTGFTQDPRNPALYGWQAWVRYPSLPRMLAGIPAAGPACSIFTCMDAIPSPRDVALIADRVAPGEPAAMFDFYDWTYHIAARRPPLGPLIPTSGMLTTHQVEQFHERIARSRYLFVAADEQGNPRLQNTALQGWAIMDEYSVEARGDRLLALRRKSIAGHDR